MLFLYQYQTHTIENLQVYIDHLVLEVWCQADATTPFDISLLHADLQMITLAIQRDSRITTDHLYGPIEEIYQIFQGLDQATKDRLAQAYRDNNAIEDLCRQTGGRTPFLYSALKVISTDLETKIKKFFKALFTDVIHLGVVQAQIGEIDNHYDAFMTINDEGKCPFCGINSIKGQYHTKREAYDHYLPKDVYPFNAINFHNLAPMCHECNSSYKGVKDPLHHKNSDRTFSPRKAFYVYSATAYPPLEIRFELTNIDIHNLQPTDIDLQITCIGHSEEISSWSEVFGIEERYRAKCLEKNEGMYWYQQIESEYLNAQTELGGSFTKAQWIQFQINSARRTPYAQANFLKAAFLEACLRAGVFS